MIDLFNRRKVRELESHLAEKDKEILHLNNQITYLIRTIRSMDDIIFSMGQMTSWESMRPRFHQLHDEMTARKVAESNRINSLIEGELHQTYESDNPMKRIAP